MGTINPSNSIQSPGSAGVMPDESLQRALMVLPGQLASKVGWTTDPVTGGIELLDPSGGVASSINTPIRQKLAGLMNAARRPLAKKVMTTPPTLAQEANSMHPAAWTVALANAVLVKAIPVPTVVSPTDPRFHFSAPEMVQVVVPNQGYNDGSKYDFLCSQSPSGYGGASLTNVIFNTDAPYFGIALSQSTVLTMLVDGEYIAATPLGCTVAGSAKYYISVSFGAVRRSREIQLVFSAGCGFGGIAIGPNDTMFSPKIPLLRITGEGDSYCQLSTTSFYSGILSEMALAIGADYFCAPVGGTGYVHVNGVYPNAQTRISQIINAHGGHSDVVMVALGINDAMDGTIDAGVMAYYKALRIGLPNSLFIVIGAFCPVETNGALYLAGRSNPIFAAVRAAGGPYIILDNISGTFESSWGTSGSVGGLPWQTGTGKVGTTTGSGNGDIYVSSDGTHPNVAGADYLSDRIFTGIQTALNS